MRKIDHFLLHIIWHFYWHIYYLGTHFGLPKNAGPAPRPAPLSLLAPHLLTSPLRHNQCSVEQENRRPAILASTSGRISDVKLEKLGGRGSGRRRQTKREKVGDCGELRRVESVRDLLVVDVLNIVNSNRLIEIGITRLVL